jgi:hypothetical protein
MILSFLFLPADTFLRNIKLEATLLSRTDFMPGPRLLPLYQWHRANNVSSPAQLPPPFLQSSSPAQLPPPIDISQSPSPPPILSDQDNDSSCVIISDASSDSGESTASYETVMYPDHPVCKEYHFRSGQYSYTHKNLANITDDGLKYKTVVSLLELTEILDSGIGPQCGRLHWRYTTVKVFQDGAWHTVMLTDGCIDRGAIH